MKVNIFKPIKRNSGKLEKQEEQIILKKNNWIQSKKGGGVISHPLKYTQPIAFENKNVYFLYFYGKENSNSGIHISLTFCQNQRFLLMQKKHWIQQENNIRYIINLIFLILGLLKIF